MATWLPDRSPPIEPGESSKEWLYCLKGTRLGDRQVVWQGVHGPGVAAVVDFNGEVRPREATKAKGRYEGWGVFTALPRPISVEVAQSHPVLARRFAQPGLKALIGPISLQRNLAMAIDDLAGGLPAAPPLRGDEADWDAAGGDWSGERLPPEEVTEKLMADKRRIAHKLGLVGEIRALGNKKRLANGKVPDLWCEAGVVGDVKNQVTADWGPGQLDGYLEQCDLEYPEHQWRGVLVQGLPEMAPNALHRLEKSPYRERIEVWAVTRKHRLSPVQARRLFPSD
ncbi:MAG: hypothetical protein M3Y22_18610 [Pseudomonadota bacterium]|nr:hypothetical protein [Pseudomonadota bacterium]